jgi:hypothetical protein
VAHACNPNYSRSRDQEDHRLKPAQANSLRNPISKILHKNRTGGLAQGEGPEFKSQCHKKLHNGLHRKKLSFVQMFNERLIFSHATVQVRTFKAYISSSQVYYLLFFIAVLGGDTL